MLRLPCWLEGQINRAHTFTTKLLHVEKEECAARISELSHTALARRCFYDEIIILWQIRTNGGTAFQRVELMAGNRQNKNSRGSPRCRTRRRWDNFELLRHQPNAKRRTHKNFILGARGCYTCEQFICRERNSHTFYFPNCRLEIAADPSPGCGVCSLAHPKICFLLANWFYSNLSAPQLRFQQDKTPLNDNVFPASTWCRYFCGAGNNFFILSKAVFLYFI